MTLHYPVEVFWSEEDGGWIAIAPDLPGCSAFGESRPEALKGLEPTIEAWIEAAKAAGNPVPTTVAEAQGLTVETIPQVISTPPAAP